MGRKKGEEIRPGDCGIRNTRPAVTLALVNSLYPRKSASVYLRSTLVSFFRGRAPQPDACMRHRQE